MKRIESGNSVHQAHRETVGRPKNGAGPVPDGDLDTVALMLKEYGSHKLLTHEEERALAQRIESGRAADALLAITTDAHERVQLGLLAESAKEARNTLFTHNLRLVIDIAKKYLNRGLELRDLVQEGYFGLEIAADKYEWQRGWRFSTYATWWVRQKIERAVIDKGRSIRIPVQTHRRFIRLLNQENMYFMRHGKYPTYAQLAEITGMKESTIRMLMPLRDDTPSIDLDVGEARDTQDAEMLRDLFTEKSMLPHDVVEHRDEIERISRCLDLLPERWRSVLLLRAGLTRPSGTMTLEDVGEHFGLTRERIRQIETQAMEALRVFIHRETLEESAVLLGSGMEAYLHVDEDDGQDRQKRTLSSGNNGSGKDMSGFRQINLPPLERELRYLNIMHVGKQALASFREIPDTDTKRIDGALRKIDAGRAAQRALVRLHGPLVDELVGEYEGRGVARDELVKNANAGLIHAISVYAADTDIEFTKYIRQRVRSSIVGTIKRHRLDAMREERESQRNQSNDIEIGDE